MHDLLEKLYCIYKSAQFPSCCSVVVKLAFFFPYSEVNILLVPWNWAVA